MDSEILAVMEAEFLGMVNEDPIALFVGGKEYLGRKTGLTKTGKVGENGFKPDYDMTVSVYTTDIFKEGDVATIGTKRYRVDKATETTKPWHQKLNLKNEFA